MKFPFFWNFLIAVVCRLYFATCTDESDKIHFTNSWAVHIENGSEEIASEIAEKHDFYNFGQIGSLPGYFHFFRKKTESKRKRREVGKAVTLLSEEKIKWIEQQHVLERDKRSIVPDYIETIHSTAYMIQDPMYNDQWYLNNVGQSSGPSGLDINVLPVWSRGISGQNVIVAILDDGLDHTHPDLKTNYDAKASYDFNDYDEDPMPKVSDLSNCHGTKCAGEVAAEANNGICGVGVAFNSSIGGIRMLDGNVTDTIEGSALSFKKDYIDIYSCAWGPKDDGKRFGRPGTLASKALELGAKEGRQSLGSIFVWATGNGGLTDDDCNCDGYTTSVYTISIGAISDHGLSTYYTETCASTLAVTYSGGSHREKKENKIVTTTLNHKCTDEFKGTSSAAPLASGMIALMLEANANLTWRDVQHIIVETSLMTSPLDEGWRRNGAGKWFNQKFGFGRMDASAMVEKAGSWSNVADQRACWSDRSVGPWAIPSCGTVLVAMNVSACADTSSEIKSLEHVQVVLSLKHRHRGHISIELISPSGTRTRLLKTRRNDKSTKGLKDWVFMSVHFWGEDPKGIWTLAVTDNSNNNREHHREKIKYGDLEDATEALQDEMEAKNEKDFEHEKIIDDEDIFKSSEEFENDVFKDDSYKKKNEDKKVEEKVKEAKKEKTKTRDKNDKMHHKQKNKRLLRKQHRKKKQVKRKKHKQKYIDDEEAANKIVEELLQDAKQSEHHQQKLEPEVKPSVNTNTSISTNGKMQTNQDWSMASNPQTIAPTFSQQASNAIHNQSQQLGSTLTTPQSSNTSNNIVLGTVSSPHANTSVSDTSSLLPKNISYTKEENAMLENVLKTVLSEVFTNFRAGNIEYKTFEERLTGLEAALYNKSDKSPTKEKMTEVLLKALKDGKAIDKINNVLGVLENSKNQSKLVNTSFFRNAEVVVDVLKVLKDVLSTNKGDNKLKLYKERISKLLETSSNSTRKLREKLFSDLEPTADGKDVSASVISDAMSLISQIFRHKGNHKKGNKVIELPKDIRILFKGPKGKMEFPYSSIQDIMLSGSEHKKQVTKTTTSKELHHDANNIDTITLEHISVRKPKSEESNDVLTGLNSNNDDKTRNSKEDSVDTEGRHPSKERKHETLEDRPHSKEFYNDDNTVAFENRVANENIRDNLEHRGQIYDGDVGGFTIAIMKNGRKIGESRLANAQVKNYLEKYPNFKENSDRNDNRLQENRKSEGGLSTSDGNIDVEVLFDKNGENTGRNSYSKSNNRGLGKNNNNVDIDVTRFGSHRSSYDQSDKHDDILSHPGGSNTSSHPKTFEMSVNDNFIPKSFTIDVAKKKNSLEKKDKKSRRKKKKMMKKKKKESKTKQFEDDESIDFSAFPFLQLADPAQMAQIPVPPVNDNENFMQQLYEPYNPLGMPDFENLPSFEEQAAFLGNQRNYFESQPESHPFETSKRSRISSSFYGVTPNIPMQDGDVIDGDRSVERRSHRGRRSVSNETFNRHGQSVPVSDTEKLLYRQKRNEVEDETSKDDDDDDGPHVVKRSAIFSELYPSKKPAVEHSQRRSSIYQNYINSHVFRNIDAEKRSAVRKAITLEGALKKRLISMRKESSSVLNIIKRVHDDIATGDSRDLRKLERQLANIEASRTETDNISNFNKDTTHTLVRTKVSKKPSEAKQDPDEYFKYGVTASGELGTWTLKFYGTGS